MIFMMSGLREIVTIQIFRYNAQLLKRTHFKSEFSLNNVQQGAFLDLRRVDGKSRQTIDPV